MGISGLVAAVHSPFAADSGELNADAVSAQLELMIRQRVAGVFVCGSTGESHSLSVEEREQLAEEWLRQAKGTPLQVIIHVGGNCLRDSERLSAHAARHGAAAISAQAPSYYKPGSVDDLIRWCSTVAASAPDTPFYFYDIPSMTGVSLSMPEFLERAGESVPTLAGLKFTNPDLMSFQLCQRVAGGKYDIAFGVDEMLLAALAMGAVGAVGSTYNFAAPIYHRLTEAWKQGDLETARTEQFRSVQLIRLLASRGYVAAAREVMEFLGAPVGPARQPHRVLTPRQSSELRAELEALGFFNWITD